MIIRCLALWILKILPNLSFLSSNVNSLKKYKNSESFTVMSEIGVSY